MRETGAFSVSGGFKPAHLLKWVKHMETPQRKGMKCPPAVGINAASFFIRRSQSSEGALGTLTEGTAPSLTSFLLRVATLNTIIADGKYHRFLVWVIEKWRDWREKKESSETRVAVYQWWKPGNNMKESKSVVTHPLPRSRGQPWLRCPSGRWSLIVAFWAWHRAWTASGAVSLV